MDMERHKKSVSMHKDSHANWEITRADSQKMIINTTNSTLRVLSVLFAVNVLMRILVLHAHTPRR